MPSIAEFEEIETTLKASLGRGNELDQNIASAAQQLLQHEIEFRPASKPHSLQLSSLKSKYTLLRPDKKEQSKVVGKQAGSHTPLSAGSGYAAGATMNGPGPSGDAGDSLPSPRVVIYPPERIMLEWRQVHKVGAGLVNLGNTCFMNSTLQCLTHTAPLVNYCFSDEHPSTCKQQNFCLMCELRRHIKSAFCNGGAFKPHSIFQKMKLIAKHFKHGKQEDAHEFLRYMVDGLQRACLNGYAKLDKFSKETTVINQIFGGFLRSQVQCMRCSGRSNTYDPFMDLSLDIRGVYTVEDALAKYVKSETLDSDNAYKCDKCHQKVPAQKRFSIHKTPNVLTIQLNRFDFNRMAGKINRHIQFPEKLNIRPYMSQKQGEPVYYHLYGVLIHQGNHCSMGHYYCYVKAPNNIWYVMNDSMVQTVSANRVYQAEAYLLFYARTVPNHHQTSAKAPFIGLTANGLVTPKFNGASFKQAGSKPATTTKGSNDVGVPVPRQMFSPVKPPQTSTATTSSHATSTLPQKHKKISFGITSKPFQSVQNQMAQPQQQRQDSVGGKNLTTSPRIVMQIKNGKVTTIEKSPDGKSKVVKSSANKQSTLVPYDDDSDSGGEGTSKDPERKHGDRGPRVALNFRDQEKENRVSDKLPRFSQGAFNVLPNSLPGKNSPRKEKGENSVEGPHKVSTPKSGGLDSAVPRCDLTLKLNRDIGMGLKKMSIDTQSPTKINSTTTSWFVQPKDSAPSPSLGSCSSNNSNHSVNSTTEWTVEAESNSKLSSSVDKRSQTPSASWKVTASPIKERRRLFVRSESLEDGHTQAKRLKRSASLEPLLMRDRPKLSNGDKHHSLDDFSQRTATNKNRIALGAEVNSPNHNGLAKDSLSKSHNSFNVSEVTRLDFAQCSKDVTEENAEQQNFQDHSDKQPLLAQDDSSATEKVHKKHKKKKHKRDKDDERSKVKYSELEESITSEDGHSRRKHKKKKHRRDRDYSDSDRKERRRRERDDSDSDYKRKRHSNHYDSDDEGKSSRKRRKSESSDSEYTWEERTKETVLQEKSEKVQQSSEKSVPVVSWNHSLQDRDGKSNKDRENSQPFRTAWDGSKKSQVAEELQKRPSVTTWDGEKSQADIETESEDRQRNRKSWSERYEEDIDRGKVKKVKRKAEECPWSFNPFQKLQNHKNQEKSRWRGDYDSYKPQSFNNNSVPSLGRSQSDQSSYRYGRGGHYHRDHYNRNSNGNHHPSFHRSYSHQNYQKRY